MKAFKTTDLPWSEIAHELVGAEHGLDVTLLFVEAPPGRSPALHRHPYAELFVILEGNARFTVNGEEIDAGAGDVLIAEPGEPHAFVNTGAGLLRQIDIHLSPSFSTEWLDAPDRLRHAAVRHEDAS
jgi:quercetin dioxygenase-like cupin family protein